MHGLLLFVFFGGVKVQNFICNGCHDLTILCPSLSNVAIITGKGVDFCCFILDITKSKAFHLLEDSVLEYRGYI